MPRRNRRHVGGGLSPRGGDRRDDASSQRVCRRWRRSSRGGGRGGLPVRSLDELFDASRAGDRDAAARVLARSPELSRVTGPHPIWGGEPTALHVAVENGRADVAALLLEAGADPNHPSDMYDGWTPMLIAAGRESRELVDLFARTALTSTPGRPPRSANSVVSPRSSNRGRRSSASAARTRPRRSTSRRPWRSRDCSSSVAPSSTPSTSTARRPRARRRMAAARGALLRDSSWK